MIRLFITATTIIASFSFLLGCSQLGRGTGITSSTEILNMAAVEDRSVYIHRVPLFKELGRPPIIELNGGSLGKLGAKESLRGSIQANENILKAIFARGHCILPILVEEEVSVKFNSSSQANRYFFIKRRINFCDHTFDLVEVSEQTFKERFGS